ncbi:COG4315 family predicted lipoprotein [Kitasatospora sp. LaBMicrA B282]|uniref:COG4315 family predicted lipoprotein n=1 Tax=Kitasatospora sp. LaBMicrA B282 TaxID=3420949 RepID=UPI003D152ACD
MRNRAVAATILALAAATALTGCADRPAVRMAPVGAAAAPSPAPLSVEVVDTDTLGRVLADTNGHTLYLDAQERPGVFVCTGGCTTLRHPLPHQDDTVPRLPTGIAGTLTVVTRPDGTQQLAYNGSPLYTYAGDRQPGDVHGIAPHWHAVQPRNALRSP